MEVRQRGLVTGVLMAALLVAPLAEAKRAGGGKSHGMSRSSSSSQSILNRDKLRLLNNHHKPICSTKVGFWCR